MVTKLVEKTLIILIRKVKIFLVEWLVVCWRMGFMCYLWHMKLFFNASKFATSVKTKRIKSGMSLRDLQIVTATSPSTLSRIENGLMPEMITFINICNWLEENPTNFFK